MANAIGTYTVLKSRKNRRSGAFVPDRYIAALLLLPVLALLAILYPVVLVFQGRPFLYGSLRMASTEREFTLWKIRTMTPSTGRACTVLGGHLAASVTPIGAVLRSLRLDELPQIFNVLAGDMRFIGPRPPLPKYVNAYPELYNAVLKTPPGITGLATVMLHRREQRLLSRCTSSEAADRLYREHCIPLKARLDILYQSRRSLRLDLFILGRTLSGLFPRPFTKLGSHYRRPVNTATFSAREPRRV